MPISEPQAGPPVATFQSCSMTSQIVRLVDPRYRLTEPISVVVEFHRDKVIVSDEQVDMYGCGPTLNDALADYRQSLVQYFDWLQANEATLASHLRDHLEWLRRHLRHQEAA